MIESKKPMAAVAVIFTMSLIGSLACSRKGGEPTRERKVMEAAVSGELVSAREIAETDLKCPDGTRLSGGDGALRSSYGCAKSGDPEGKYHGPYGQWYRNGTRAVAGQFDEWKQTGEWTWWRADGTVDSKVEYQGGQLHGISVKLAEDGSVLERTEFEHGSPVSGSVGEPAPIPEPDDISCPSIARRVDELAQAEMGAGIPEDKRESVEKAMKTMREGLKVRCAVHLSRVQRLCFMVAPRIAAMRWCQGPGPQRCEEAVARA